MAKVEFTKGLAANLPSKIKEGCIYFTTDTGKLYIDVSTTERIQINPNSDWNAESGNAAIANKPTGATVVKTLTTANAGSTAPANNVGYWSFSNNILELKQLGYTTGNSLN